MFPAAVAQGEDSLDALKLDAETTYTADDKAEIGRAAEKLAELARVVQGLHDVLRDRYQRPPIRPQNCDHN